jgi:hypothetical protein
MMTKTVVGLYDDLAEARRVVDDLVSSGINQDQISLLLHDPKNQYRDYLETVETGAGEASSGAAAGAVSGAVIGGLSGVLLGLGAVIVPGIGPVIAAGPIVAGLVGAGVGAAAGGVAGALIGWGIPEEEATYYTEGIRQGGTLVAVKALDGQVEQITTIMNQHNPINLRERADLWRRSGWTGGDTPADEIGEMSARTGTNYQAHYNSTYAATSRNYADYEPAYYYGYTLGIDDRYRGRTWDELEPEARQYWETTYYDQGAWDDFKDAVKHAWRDATNWRSDSTYDQDYQRHYDTYYARTGRPYSYYQPAYRYGYALATDTRYADKSWEDVEPTARRDWETQYQDKGAWADFKDSVKYAWDRMTSWISDDYDHDYYQQHYQANFANTGRPYTYYEPAYHFGHNLATDSTYRGGNWHDLEPEFRRRWETEYGHQGAWQEIKSAVWHAWDRLSNWGDYDNEFYDSGYRTHYNTSYASTGQPYDYYEPAYRYGTMMALDERYRGRDWSAVEPEVRRQWEQAHGHRGAWDNFKDAIGYAWSHAPSASPAPQHR